MRRKNTAPVIAWALFALCAVGVITQFVIWWIQRTIPPTLFEIAEVVVWNVVGPLAFAVLAALVITRQPGNRVGWLMMIIALGGIIPVKFIDNMSVPPERLTPGLWLLLWYYGWGWVPTMFPIFLIPLHFPTGRPPSPRWNWVNYLAVGMVVFFLSTASFTNTIETTNWTLPNPLGFIPNEIWEGPLAVFWFIGLITLVLSSIASLFLRYRKANQVVRQQIKWLLFAVAIFASIYIYTGFTILILNPSNISPTANPSPPNLANLVFNLAVLVIPAAIAVSILRYRLYDIDLIIRRTLQYSLLTGLLSLVYFGGVALLQGLLSAFDGQSSPVVIVLTTLMIAALFNPLRRRLQDFIDRRFYRRKYDAERALADFATKARSETDMGHLSSEIVRVAQETMQPERVSLWLKQ